jgi:hypothetical protein
MVVNEAKLDAFRAVARDKIWPVYQKDYPELWEVITSSKA